MQGMERLSADAPTPGSIAASNPSCPVPTIGCQVVLDLYECATAGLDDIEWVRATLIAAARIAGATIVDVVFHKFSPWGISGVVVISESHLAIHIWPEKGYAAVDVFTCGDTVDLDRAVNHLVDAFEAGRSALHRIFRGSGI